MRNMFLVAAALGMSACGGGGIQYSGYQIFDHFPLDGQRSWEYANDDLAVDYKIEVRMSDLTTTNGDITVHKFQTYNDTTGDLIRSVDWSSNSSDGVLIHGFETFDASGGGGGGGGGGTGGDGGGPGGGDGGGSAPPAAHNFSGNPVIFGESDMAPGDFVVTEADGWTFTSTFEAVEPCPNHWVGEEWNECLRFYLDDGVDGQGGAAIAGYYWIVPRYGVAWMELDSDTATWRLVTANWSPDE